MATVGLMPDLDRKHEQAEGGKEIIDRFIRGEISLEEFVGLLPQIDRDFGMTE